MDISSGIQASLAGRYALALFELARDQKQLETVGASLAAVREALDQSDDFRELTTSPLIGRDDAVKAVAAAADAMQVDPLTRNFLGVLAQNRRVGELPAVIRAFRAIAAGQRGEVTAEVASAHPLTDDQLAALEQKLRAREGRTVKVRASVQPDLLGGLVVTIGSKRIDSSIRSRLNSLAQAMKG